MLCVVNKPFMLSVVMLNGIMLSVVILNVILGNVAAPFQHLFVPLNNDFDCLDG
jgi:hypothetical protein